jgi:hypothetical protein
MEETIKGRLEALKRDFESGERELSTLERRCDELRGALLRISGAIQVLEEVLKPAEPGAEQPALEAVR